MSTNIITETTTTDEVSETNSRIKGLFSKVGSGTMTGVKATKTATVKAAKVTGHSVKVASVKVYNGSASDIVDVTVDGSKAVAFKAKAVKSTISQARQVRKMIKASIKQSMSAE